MMETGDPEGYEAIRDQLPPRSRRKQELTEELTACQLAWYEELVTLIPRTLLGGRPLRREEEKDGWVSIETYLKGEFSTFSEQTLELCRRQFRRDKEKGRNPVREIYENMAEEYGYGSLEELEGKR